MNNALTKTLTAGLMHGLKLNFNEEIYDLSAVTTTQIGFSKNKKLRSCRFEGDLNPLPKPYLLHTSSLTKEIEFGRKKITPIFELAKICHPNWPWEILRKTDVHDTFMWIDFDFESCPEYSFGIEKNVEDINFFTLREGDPRDTRFQIKAYEWLIEHHFNVFGLSPEEFIEVNETNNPYR